MKNISTRDQKIFLNILLIGAFLFICLLFLGGLFFVWHPSRLPGDGDIKTNISIISVQIGISIILIWFMIFLPYLAWAVYFYNINLGKTNEEWEAIKRRNEEREGDEDEIVPENPYRDETFGLPKGTIRGSIAITLMVGALSMFVVAIGHPTILRNNEFFHENFEFFKTAFLMMIAFYFGSKSLEHLKERWTIDTGSPGQRGRMSPPADEPEEEPRPFPEDAEPRYATATPTAQPAQVDKPKVKESFSLVSSVKALAPEAAPEEELPLAISKQLIAQPGVGINKTVSEDEIAALAKELGLEVAALRAVIDIESAGKGFLPDGRTKILFEGHIFWNELQKAGIDPAPYAKKHPDIVYPKWTKQYYKGGAAEYERLNTASLINEDSALRSSSWGMFQIMGFNHKLCGFDHVKPFVDAMGVSEEEHLKAFTKFCESRKLIDLLRKKDWAAFAKAYNGPGYAQNQYDYKLEMRYHYYSRRFNDKMWVKITRDPSSDKQTTGTLTVYDDQTEIFKCKTLELPWKNNQRNISCIPKTDAAPYTVVKRHTDERKDHFHILNVPQRSSILIHSGNYYTHTLGCILVGKDHTDLNKDGYADVTNSKVTLSKLNDLLPDTFLLTIA